MNQENFSDLFKRRFLIEFTKELIMNSKKEADFIEVEIPETTEMKFRPKKSFGIRSGLRIPEPVLPPKFQYLHPYPVQKEIELGKINPLIRDPQVRVIECNGEDEPLIVEGTMGRKITKIILNKEEINEIIRTFSEEGKIPIKHGIHRIVVGRLIFSAIISDIVSTKFVIRKMMLPTRNY